MIEAVIVAQFVAGHAGAEIIPQPDASGADVTQTGPSPARHRPKADQVKIVVAQHVAGGDGRTACVRAQLGVIIVRPVIGGGLGHAKRARDLRPPAIRREARAPEGGFGVKSVQAANERDARVVRERRAWQI